MHDCIHFAIYKNIVRYIMTLKRKFGIPHQVGNVVGVSRDEIVEANDLVAFRQQARNQPSADEARCA